MKFTFLVAISILFGFCLCIDDKKLPLCKKFKASQLSHYLSGSKGPRRMRKLVESNCVQKIINWEDLNVEMHGELLKEHLPPMTIIKYWANLKPTLFFHIYTHQLSIGIIGKDLLPKPPLSHTKNGLIRIMKSCSNNYFKECVYVFDAFILLFLSNSGLRSQVLNMYLKVKSKLPEGPLAVMWEAMATPILHGILSHLPRLKWDIISFHLNGKPITTSFFYSISKNIQSFCKETIQSGLLQNLFSKNPTELASYLNLDKNIPKGQLQKWLCQYITFNNPHMATNFGILQSSRTFSLSRSMIKNACSVLKYQRAMAKSLMIDEIHSLILIWISTLLDIYSSSKIARKSVVHFAAFLNQLDSSDRCNLFDNMFLHPGTAPALVYLSEKPSELQKILCYTDEEQKILFNTLHQQGLNRLQGPKLVEYKNRVFNLNYSLLTPEIDQNTFFLTRTIQKLETAPLLILSPTVQLSLDYAIDTGGPKRHWISSIWSYMQTNIMEASTRVDDRISIKFSWLLSPKCGFIAGVFLAKAIQSELTLSFNLDPKFLDLLTAYSEFETDQEKGESLIRDYFASTYQHEIKELLQVWMCHGWGPSTFETVKDSIRVPRPQKLTLTEMMGEKSNIHNAMGGYRIKKSARSFEKMPIIHKKLVKAALKAFISFFTELYRALSLSLRMKHLHVFFKKKDSSLLQSLLQPQLHASIIDKVRFDYEMDYILIESHIPGHQISLKWAIISVLQSLNTKQISSLLSVWAGSENLVSSEREPLKALFQQDISEFFNFQTPSSRANGGFKMNFSDGPLKDEYYNLIKDVANAQLEILKLFEFPPFTTDSIDKGLIAFHDGLLNGIHVSACTMEIYFSQQCSSRITHALFSAINFPVNYFLD